MSGFNPLFDSKRDRTAVTASANNPLLRERVPSQTTPVIANATPASPITKKPMSLAYCGNIPVYVDLESRVVLPIRD